MPDTIYSFTKDHKALEPGIYKNDSGYGTETFDLRFCKPNVERIPVDAMHTIEHLLAVACRNHTRLPVIYVGPMGCLTGLYLIVSAGHSSAFVKEQLQHAIQWALEQDTVPGATEGECGSYLMHNLPLAKEWLQTYLYILDNFELPPDVPLHV